MTLRIQTSKHGNRLGLSAVTKTGQSHLVIPMGSISPETGVATATAGAATLNKAAGSITSESLSTAAAATYTLTLTNDRVALGDIVMATVAFGTSTTGVPTVARATSAAGSVVIIIQNIAAAAAFNGTIVISYVVFKI